MVINLILVVLSKKLLYFSLTISYYPFATIESPCPITPKEWYDPNMPLVETFEQARHFRLGPKAYEKGQRPWKEPIPKPRVA